MKLDHVAIATRDVGPIIDVLVGELGRPVIFGGFNLGFRAMQLECGDLRIELLEPHNVERFDFLERFLVANGQGPHHLTFKTDDIRTELRRAGELGYAPTGVNIDNDFWKEMFIHPKQAGGTVVQVAQSSFEPMDIEGFRSEGDRPGPGKWWPDPPAPAADQAVLRRVVVSTNDPQRSLVLYRDFLRGEIIDERAGWIELQWAGRGRIALQTTDGKEGIDRLEWSADGPPRELVVGGTRFVVGGA